MANIVNFGTYKCIPKFYHYMESDRIAIRLVDFETGEPIATATTNMPELVVLPNNIIIKDYAENEGMYKALLEAGIVKEAEFWIKGENNIDFYISELNIIPIFQN